MRRLLMAVAVLFVAGAAGTALAFSRCDVGLIKAKGKSASCECGAVAKAIATNTFPLIGKCELKFTRACTKAQGAGDCAIQTKSCMDNQLEVDAFVIDHCESSPSGAFLN